MHLPLSMECDSSVWVGVGEGGGGSYNIEILIIWK